jgi:hypothetical protein
MTGPCSDEYGRHSRTGIIGYGLIVGPLPTHRATVQTGIITTTLNLKQSRFVNISVPIEGK